MTKIDQFESVFKASAKEPYRYTFVELARGLVITDLDGYEARLFGEDVRSLLRRVDPEDRVEWRDVAGSEFSSVRDLLDLVEAERPDLVCAYRNLHSGAWRWPYSLGSHLEVLTQVTTTPVLLMPRPRLRPQSGPRPEAEDEGEGAPRYRGTPAVMAITDHLTGDHRLVDWAARFTEPGGTLFLAHVEDSAVFERYVEVIGKIPTIDTETATAEIERQLLKEPHDYVTSCRAVLEDQEIGIEVSEVVRMGHHLTEYKALIAEHELSLLVMNTKDEDQHAMHGLAYPLAIELRDIPLLML